MSDFIYHKLPTRQLQSFNYWYDVIMGGIIAYLMIALVGDLILTRLELQNFILFHYILTFIIIMYYQWEDDNFSFVQTGLSKKDNILLIEYCLESLKWNNSKKIQTVFNNYLLKFLHPVIIPIDKKIAINFQYHSTSKTGRLPFFFGISTYLKWKLINTIKKLNKV
ncbi:MAG: hypothetical protein MUC49_05670 [Raineya sp.]|nr:hypothetical protein [Raineya sp.]